MDSNAAAKLLDSERPQQQAAAADELPALAASSEGSGRQRTLSLSGKYLRALAALALFSDYFSIVGQNLSDWAWRVGAYAYYKAADELPLWFWRKPALIALAYAVAAALIWFIGRLEERRRRLQPADDHEDDTRWEGRVKLAARFLVHAIIGVLLGYSSSVAPCAMFVFMWVKSGDQVYIKVQKEEEIDRVMKS